MNLFIPVITMGLIAFVLSVGLFFAYKKLKVAIDPRLEEIAEILPQANCGACGFAGCQALAEALVAGQAEPNACPVGGNEVATRLAAILGVESSAVIKKVARLHCRGHYEAAPVRSLYVGVSTCFAAHLLGGYKLCTYGCLHLGDCVRACQFEAMVIGQDGLPLIDEQKCTGCGKCVEACPRGLLELHPVERNIFVFCRSLDRPAVSRKVCKNACIACNICVRACPEAIIMESNLARIIDWKKIPVEKIPAIEKCPTGAISRLKKEIMAVEVKKTEPQDERRSYCYEN
ncbi:MAG: RnfABCDGE type electron transport complex subunit B [Candidatus Aminicenantes bacterium]|nr:RnfABCDGE type electron transport complex subunit B [Candidatus Aminicenantes bacterium]